ncbi:Lebercilin [Oopsacas minuta]|uniref:Lebercilin n=1 Tax=Oopsacas minuta TaxID=111878 RepID=A0AAV7KJP6_9METZ|nr:Lebercilin [Oopsacas minuta]
MSEASDGYSEDFDEEINSDPENRTPFIFKESKTRKRTPAIILNKPEGRIREMTMGIKHRQVANRGANSLPTLGRGSDRILEPSPLRVKKRMVSHDGGKPPNDRVLSANLRTIRSLQSALKEKELLTEQLVKENKLYKRFDILAQKEVSRIEREHKNLPELIRRHETEIVIQKDRYKKVVKDNSDIIRRKEHLENELIHCKAKLVELKKISENRKLEERHSLSLRLEEELSRNQQLSSRLQEAERKLAMQDKSIKREKAELQARCKKKEERIYLMELNMKDIDSQMRTKRKQLEKLNIYSLRIEKNLPPNMNITDLLIPQEDKCTLTSPSLLKPDQLFDEREEAQFEEQRFSLPPTLSQAQSSHSTNFTRTSYQMGQLHDASPPTQISELSIHPKKQHYPNLSPPITHSQPGNYSESDAIPTLQTSSGLTNLTPYPTPIGKNSPHTSEVTSPPMPILSDPPLSTINEISTTSNISPTKTHPIRKSLPQTIATQVIYDSSNSISAQHNTHTTDIDASEKELLLRKLKQIDLKDSSSTNQTNSLASSTLNNSSLPESAIQPQDILEMQPRSLRQEASSGTGTPVNQSDTSNTTNVNKGKKKKALALDDLFSNPSAQGSETKLASSNMDPGLFSAPRHDSPLFFNNEKQFGSIPQEPWDNKREEAATLQQDTHNRINNHIDGEDTHDVGRKASVVENMFHGKPAYSTEDDFYGSKVRKLSPNKSSHAFQIETDSDRKPQHGRRAKETNSPPPNSDKGYFWENNITASKINTLRPPPTVPVDDLDDDLEVIQL